MRATLSLDRRLVQQALALAKATGLSLSELVTTALLRELEHRSKGAANKPFTLITFRGTGLNPGYEWDKLEDQTYPYPAFASGESGGD